MHAIMKEDMAGGHLPSARFGANAAWWGIMALAFNLNSLMKRLVLPQGWAPKRLKTNRFGFINLAGRVVSRARQLIIRFSGGHPAYELLMEVRRRLRNGLARSGALHQPRTPKYSYQMVDFGSVAYLTGEAQYYII